MTKFSTCSRVLCSIYLIIIIATGLICAYTCFLDLYKDHSNDRIKYIVPESLLLFFMNVMHVIQGMIIGVWYGIWSPIIIFVHIIDLIFH